MIKSLRNIALEQKLDLTYILKLYTLEAFLQSLSALRLEQVIVRGSLITRFWAYPKHYRAVQDLDVVVDTPLDENLGKKIIEQTISTLPESISMTNDYHCTRIWEDTELPALRFSIPTQIYGFDFLLQLDMAFNDPIVPPAVYQEYKNLLGDTFLIRTVRPELACAWKIHGLFEFWNQGLRWQAKTLYDIFLILDTQTLNSTLLKEALRVAFEDRKTPVRTYQRVLDGQFGQSKGAQRGWAKWLEQNEGRIPYDDFQPLLAFIRQKTDPLFIELMHENTH